MATLHGSAVLVGPRAVLIRGPSGSGKSALVLGLLGAADSGLLPFARLVADDRVILSAHHGRLLVQAPEAVAGLVERRGHGILRLPHEPMAIVGRVVDLDAADAARLPEEASGQVVLEGVVLPRTCITAGVAALPVVIAALRDLR